MGPYEYLVAIHDLCHRRGLVLAPFMDGTGTLHDDDEVLVHAFVVDLGDGVVATDHDGIRSFVDVV